MLVKKAWLRCVLHGEEEGAERPRMRNTAERCYELERCYEEEPFRTLNYELCRSREVMTCKLFAEIIRELIL